MSEKSGKIIASLVGVVVLSVLSGIFVKELEAQRVRQQAFLERQQKIQQARDQVARAAACPPREFVDLVEEPDPWGRDLVVRRRQGSLRSVKLICLGPDGMADTTDDIAAYRELAIDWEQAGENMGQAGADLSKGLLRGLKKSLARKQAE